jgi:hypothetical protein
MNGTFLCQHKGYEHQNTVEITKCTIHIEILEEREEKDSSSKTISENISFP